MAVGYDEHLECGGRFGRGWPEPSALDMAGARASGR
jgi:hypothetical protein